MISNPCTFFVSGNAQEKFTYEGGTTLFHFSPNDNSISSTMENNLVFFANNEDHALEVLKRMFQFAILCKAKYLKYLADKKPVHWEEFYERAKKEEPRFSSYIKLIEEGKIKLTKAPSNQFFIVGWASNYTIH